MEKCYFNWQTQHLLVTVINNNFLENGWPPFVFFKVFAAHLPHQTAG